MNHNLEQSYLFAEILCKALGEYAYVVVGFLLSPGGSNQVLTYGNWSGIVPSDVDSRAPHIAYGKFGELVLANLGQDGELIMTPTPGNEQSYGWMGGVAQNRTGVAVSKWAEEHDKLLALLTLYNAVQDRLNLHHVGFRFPNRETYEDHNLQFKFTGGISRPAENHERVYFNLGKFYREHQFYPGGPHDSARHWDFACCNPKDLLLFIAHAYGTEPSFWEAGPNDPIGAVWIPDKKGNKLGVMARHYWWVVEA